MVEDIRQGGGDPCAYPEDLFERLPAMASQDDLTPLLPRHWLEARRKEAADREAASVPEIRKFSRRCPASFPPRSRRAAIYGSDQPNLLILNLHLPKKGCS